MCLLSSIALLEHSTHTISDQDCPMISCSWNIRQSLAICICSSSRCSWRKGFIYWGVQGGSKPSIQLLPPPKKKKKKKKSFDYYRLCVVTWLQLTLVRIIATPLLCLWPRPCHASSHTSVMLPVMLLAAILLATHLTIGVISLSLWIWQSSCHKIINNRQNQNLKYTE